jgi:hypothetical protein
MSAQDQKRQESNALQPPDTGSAEAQDPRPSDDPHVHIDTPGGEVDHKGKVEPPPCPA